MIGPNQKILTIKILIFKCQNLLISQELDSWIFLFPSVPGNGTDQPSTADVKPIAFGWNQPAAPNFWTIKGAEIKKLYVIN